MSSTSRFVTHLESAIDGTRLPADQVQTVHQGRPLWVRYDLEAVSRCVSPPELAKRAATMWCYRELLPLPDGIEAITLGDAVTWQETRSRVGIYLF